MNVCTAVGAIDSKKNYTITFKSEAHKIFYLKYLPECRYQDVYHKALVYCLGIDADTRNHVNSIYDFKTGCVKTKCLNEGWQNSGSIKIVRMAFNLYCNGTPSVHVRMLYSGRIILLWLCKIFLGGSQNPVSGILLLNRIGGHGYAENQTAGNNK